LLGTETDEGIFEGGVGCLLAAESAEGNLIRWTGLLGVLDRVENDVGDLLCAGTVLDVSVLIEDVENHHQVAGDSCLL
jgi:hypothetical protein